MRLTEVDSSGDAGIDVVASPPGKRLQNILLLSGGEKAMTALALLIAIFKYQPSPFCILDEVDAPLDEANVGRFTRLVGEMSGQTQFIIVTHNRKTMETGSVLYGVTMQEPGVSKLVSVRWEGDEAPAQRHAPLQLPQPERSIFHRVASLRSGFLFFSGRSVRARRYGRFALQSATLLSFSDFLVAIFPHMSCIDFTSRCARMHSTFFRGKFALFSGAAMRVVRETKFAGISPAATREGPRHLRSRRQTADRGLGPSFRFRCRASDGISDKGRVLTQLSLFWFDLLRDIIPNHVLSATEFPAAFDAYREELAGRSMMVRKTQPLPIECVVRGYVSGFGMERLSSDGENLRHRSACRLAGVGSVAGADLHAGDESGHRSRRKYSFRPGGLVDRQRTRGAGARHQHGNLLPRGGICGAARDSAGRHKI